MSELSILDMALRTLAEEKKEKEDLVKWQKDLPGIFEKFIKNEILDGVADDLRVQVKEDIVITAKGDLTGIKSPLSLIEFLSVFSSSFSFVYSKEFFGYLNNLGFGDEQIFLTINPTERKANVYIGLSSNSEKSDGSYASGLLGRINEILTRRVEFNNLLSCLEEKILTALRNGEEKIWLWHGYEGELTGKNCSLPDNFYPSSFLARLYGRLKNQGLSEYIVWDNNTIGVNLADLRKKYEAGLGVEKPQKLQTVSSGDDAEKKLREEHEFWEMQKVYFQ